VPLSWLREYVELPTDTSAREVADRLVSVGLEVEAVDVLGSDLGGSVVVGRVLSFVEEEHSNGKTIRWCSVDVGEAEPRGIVCGARNFAVGDKVAVALPGAVLPGGFAISARATYDHISDGMICSARELAMGDEHSGILVLPPDSEVGSDAIELLGLRDEVLDIAVTPDRGYCLSMRGIAREAATAYGVEFRDPAQIALPAASGSAYDVRVEDVDGCDRFVAKAVTGFDPAARSPLWLQRRVHMAGMRPISLAVDVTNYVMLELGQPLHAYDRDLLQGPIVVRRAVAGEKLRTLDGVVRELDPEDLLITDDSGPIGIAGTMGGATTEIGDDTRNLVLEAAHFDPVTTARSARRHKLPSEASRRFERGVDPALPEHAAQRAVELFTSLGGGEIDPGVTVVGEVPTPASLTVDEDLFDRVLGWSDPDDVDGPATAVDIAGYLRAVGCEVETVDVPAQAYAPRTEASLHVETAALRVTPPTWRPDLTDPNDLVEEVARLHGYDAIPSRLPQAPAGRGWTATQRARRRVGQALAAAGYVEVLNYPFVGEKTWDDLGLPADDQRRIALRLLNPISDEEPLLRTTLLPGLLAALRRNVGRGAHDLALFELATVVRPHPDAGPAPRLGVDRRPTDDELARLQAAIPAQPWRVGVVLAGNREPAGWWGSGRAESWADAVEAARAAAAAVGVTLDVSKDEHAPWHPGRCARLSVDGVLVGHAGELHPRVVSALDLPPRTAVAELELDRLLTAVGEPVQAPRISTFPVATQDVALVVDQSVPAVEVEAALRVGAGDLLEDLRLFDVYEGDQVSAGQRSLAYHLRFRAPDRTLTDEEAGGARDAAVAEATRRTGARLRST
jgi:phenylalanyl-tRNA synthetase beta chain